MADIAVQAAVPGVAAPGVDVPGVDAPGVALGSSPATTKRPSFMEMIANPGPTRSTQGMYFHHYIMYEFMLCSAGKGLDFGNKVKSDAVLFI